LRFEKNGDPEEGVSASLYSLFNGKFIKEGHTLIDVDNNTYYLAKAHTTTFGSIAGFTYLIGFNGERRKSA